MDLREHIKKVLTEDNSINTILRRVDSDKLKDTFEETLEVVTDIFYKNKYYGINEMTFNNFRSRILNMVIDMIHDDMVATTPDETMWYGEVFNTLKNYFNDKIETAYNRL